LRRCRHDAASGGKKLEPEIKEKDLARFFYEMEMPLVKVLADMERVGTRIDRPTGSGWDGNALQADRLEKEVYKLAGERSTSTLRNSFPRFYLRN